jgi:hypothetical protein
VEKRSIQVLTAIMTALCLLTLSLSAPVQVKAETIHDVAIVNATAYPAQVRAGDIVNVTFYAQNQGTQMENVSLTWCIYIGVPPLVIHIGGGGGQTLAIAEGEIIPVTFEWNTTGLSPGNYGRIINVTFVDPDIIDEDPGDNTAYTNLVNVNGTVGGVVEFPQIEEPGAAIPDLSDHNYGALAGIIVGAIVGVIMLISAVWYIRRRRTKAI